MSCFTNGVVRWMSYFTHCMLDVWCGGCRQILISITTVTQDCHNQKQLTRLITQLNTSRVTHSLKTHQSNPTPVDVVLVVMRRVERHEVLGSLTSLARPPRPSSTPHWPSFWLSCKIFFSSLPGFRFFSSNASGGFLVERRAYVALREQVLGWPNFITTQMFPIISTRKAPKTEYQTSQAWLMMSLVSLYRRTTLLVTMGCYCYQL